MASAAEANSKELESLKKHLAVKEGEYNIVVQENGALLTTVDDLRAKMVSTTESNTE